MRAFATIFCILILARTAYSQDLINRTDSLINLIESSKNPAVKIQCDTTFASHSDYFLSICTEYYSTENKFIRIVIKFDRFKVFNFYDSVNNEKPSKTGIISIDAFYIHNDALIKVIRADYDRPPLSVTYLYFTGKDLAYMEERGWKGTPDYKEIEHCIGLANELLNNFKRNK